MHPRIKGQVKLGWERSLVSVPVSVCDAGVIDVSSIVNRNAWLLNIVHAVQDTDKLWSRACMHMFGGGARLVHPCRLPDPARHTAAGCCQTPHAAA